MTISAPSYFFIFFDWSPSSSFLHSLSLTVKKT